MKIVDIMETMTIQEVVDFIIDGLKSGKYQPMYTKVLDFEDISLFDVRRKIQKKRNRGNKYDIDNVVVYSFLPDEWTFQLQNIRDRENMTVICFLEFKFDQGRGGFYFYGLGYPDKSDPITISLANIKILESWEIDTSKTLSDILFP